MCCREEGGRILELELYICQRIAGGYIEKAGEPEHGKSSIHSFWSYLKRRGPTKFIFRLGASSRDVPNMQQQQQQQYTLLTHTQ